MINTSAKCGRNMCARLQTESWVNSLKHVNEPLPFFFQWLKGADL